MNALTKGVFDTNLREFAGLGDSGTSAGNSWRITAHELVSAMMGGSAGIASNWGSGLYEPTLTGVMQRNLKANGGMMLAQIIGIPIAFKYGRKIMRKPINAANRLLKPAGVRL